VHGGTNFGFTAGANSFSQSQFQPDVTSYDYDAPIDEQGNPTPKYFALRNLISKYVDYEIPDVPEIIPAIEIPAFNCTQYTTVFDNLPKPIESVQPVPMENLDQKSGYVLYTTKLIGHKSGNLAITDLHDYALVFVDGKFIDTMFRGNDKRFIKLPKTNNPNPELEILVEALGHINFAQYMIDKKGITDRVTLNGMTLMNWKIYSLPMDEKFMSSLKKNNVSDSAKGIFYKGTFSLSKTADTYINMSNFKKGVVWVNGHNLGRFWYIGPQQKLYCPSSWLKQGNNEVIIFDLLLNERAVTASGSKTLY
jgi:beta-galactosidase